MENTYLTFNDILNWTDVYFINKTYYDKCSKLFKRLWSHLSCTEIIFHKLSWYQILSKSVKPLSVVLTVHNNFRLYNLMVYNDRITTFILQQKLLIPFPNTGRKNVIAGVGTVMRERKVYKKSFLKCSFVYFWNIILVALIMFMIGRTIKKLLINYDIDLFRIRIRNNNF